MRLLAILASLSLLATAGCLGLGKGDDVTPAAADEGSAPAPDAPLDEEGQAPAASPPPPSNNTKPASTTNASATAPAPAATPAAAPPAPRIETVSWAGSITGAGAGAKETPAGPVCCFGAGAVEDNTAGSFDVATTLRGILVELVWTDAQLDLDLELDAPDHAAPFPPSGPEMHSGHWWFAGEGTPGAPDHHASILLTDAEALALTGAWQWYVVPKGPANEVAFTVYATLFYDAPPASGYTAVPPA